MKLWKGATFAFMLCGAVLSTILIKNMATVGLKTKHSHTSSSSSKESTSIESTSRSSPLSLPSTSSSSESRASGGLHRKIRSADNMNSFLSELSMMFQSFTEGELRYVVETLLNKKRRRSRRLGENQARRTKRARRPKPCGVRKLELTVSELGLGFESDETLVLRYCSGNCDQHRHNYDIVMDHIMRTGFKKKNKGPCCRPTAFEKTSFLDNRSRYHALQNVSARHCGCV